MSIKEVSERAVQALPVVAASYLKRGLETLYDQAIQTGFGKKLTALSPAKKYTIEAILYALTAVLESRMAANSKLGKLLREVAVDIGPEMSKRIINGAREEVAEMVAVAKNPVEKDLLDALLSLGDSDLSGFIRWLSQTSLERDKIFNQLSLLSAEQVAKILKLPDAEKDQFLKFFGPPEAKPEAVPKSPESGFREKCREATQQIKDCRQRFRTERRKS